MPSRLDKNKLEELPHSIIIGRNNQHYELINSVKGEEIRLLANQVGREQIAKFLNIQVSDLDRTISEGRSHKIVLGAGSFGKVRLARDIDTGEFVAVKKIREADDKMKKKMQENKEKRK